MSDAAHDVQRAKVKLSSLKTTYAATTDPLSDITKVTANLKPTTLSATVKLAKVKKGHIDLASVYIRTKRGGTPKYVLLVNVKHPSKSVLTTGPTATVEATGVAVKTQAGKHGTVKIIISNRLIDNSKKVSVSVAVEHISTTSSFTIDAVAGRTSSLKHLKWTGFVTTP